MLTQVSRMILTGLAGIVIVEIYAAVMQREFQKTNNQVGKGFAILGIYLFVVIYCKPPFFDDRLKTDVLRRHPPQMAC